MDGWMKNWKPNSERIKEWGNKRASRIRKPVQRVRQLEQRYASPPKKTSPSVIELTRSYVFLKNGIFVFCNQKGFENNERKKQSSLYHIMTFSLKNSSKNIHNTVSWEEGRREKQVADAME